MSPIPLAFSPCLPTELLKYLLNYASSPTTLIICQSREKFMAAVVESMKEVRLTPSILQTTLSRNIELVYVTNVVELRCMLAAVEAPRFNVGVEVVEGKGNVPLLVVYGLVELHRSTSYWSASGLSDCLSMLVEAGVRSCKQVIIYDEKKGMADIWAESVPLLGQKNMETLASESTPSSTLRHIFGRWFHITAAPWGKDLDAKLL